MPAIGDIEPMNPREHQTCLNCGAPESGAFCPACGQKNSDLQAPFGELLGEVIEESLGFDSRLRHTLPPFLARPGLLTREYNAGRRSRYTSPLKLYLVASVLFFLAAARARPQVVQIGGEVGKDLQQAQLELARRPPTIGNRFAAALLAKTAELRKRDPQQANALPAMLSNLFFEMLPKAMFVLLPAFALLLKLFWWRSRRFYSEHLVFALHEHAFAMVLLALAAVMPGEHGWADALVMIAIPIHLFLALRTVFGQARLLTLLKCSGLLAVYLVVLSLAMGVLGVASLWLA